VSEAAGGSETGYLLDNRSSQAHRRFASLGALYDSATFGHLDRLGVEAGWHCLEIGAGDGRVAAQLARRVGPTGAVLATDLDPRWLSDADLPATVEVRRHDIVRDPLPEAAFDLIHERLVLIHLPERVDVLARLVRSLRPGGWLLAEDFDSELIGDGDADGPADDAEAAELLNRFRRGLRSLLRTRGAELRLGRGLAHLLTAAGLEQVGASGHLPMLAGTAAREHHLANLTQVRAELSSRGLLSDSEIDRLHQALTNAHVSPAAPLLVSAWGRRPAE
jgi:SAM-dependent methyltransferase